jgi:uncharacterized protein YndB with AHSA1/START domain
MEHKTESATQPLELSVTRVFNAPRALVWAVWTDPKHAMHWWGPDGFTTPVYEADLRSGGVLRVHMRAPDGTIFPSVGTFEEVVVPERVVTFGVVEIGGTPAFEARTTVTFEEHDGKTTVIVHQSYAKINAAGEDAIEGAHQGWTQQLDRLDDYLRSMRA